MTGAVFPLRAHGEERFAFNQTPGKLPKSVVPVFYNLILMPDVAAGRFKGREDVRLEVREAVEEIVLNAVGLKLGEVTLSGKERGDVTVRVEEGEQTVHLAVKGGVPVGTVELHLEWEGTLGEQPAGLYICRYQKEGVEKKGLATQMEPVDARRMFPCWDEPAFRAVFKLSVTCPEGWAVVSNMREQGEREAIGGRQVVSFQPTLPMPTYLLALFAGEFEKIEGEVDGVKLAIFTTPGKREQGRWALEATKEILHDYADYFGVSYPLPKLDQLALPNTGAGGMENWGCIVYREDALLFDPAASSQAQRERVYGIVAHEIAHQWFGDLVTMAWWDNLWLNEGFASWMATKQAARRHPEWKPWLRAASGKEFAMRLDARATTHPIQQPVRTESEAGDVFDEITYQKGQAVIRMVEGWLGVEAFREGIRGYVKAHVLSNTTTADLWSALGTASGKDVAAFAKGWTEQPGFPVVTVAAVPDGEVIRPVWWQERFAVHQEKAEALQWMIPLLTAPAGDPQRAVAQLLAPGHFTYVKADPATVDIGNVGGTGYYRMEYPEPEWKRLLKAVGAMAEADRLTLLHDSWALAQAGRKEPGVWLALADALVDTASPTELEQMLGVLGQMDGLARAADTLREGGGRHRARLREWALGFLRPQLARLGWEAGKGESTLATLARPRLLALAAVLDDAETLRTARSRFVQWLAEPASLDANLRGTVLTMIGREADAATWTKLHALAAKESSYEQKRELYTALAAARDPDLAAQTLALALTPELPPRDAASLVARVAHLGEHPEEAWVFTRTHWPALAAKLTAHQADEFVPELFTAFAPTAARASELEQWAAQNLPPGATPSVAKAADEVLFQAQFRTRALPEIEAWMAAKLPPPARPVNSAAPFHCTHSTGSDPHDGLGGPTKNADVYRNRMVCGRL